MKHLFDFVYVLILIQFVNPTLIFQILMFCECKQYRDKENTFSITGFRYNYTIVRILNTVIDRKVICIHNHGNSYYCCQFSIVMIGIQLMNVPIFVVHLTGEKSVWIVEVVLRRQPTNQVVLDLGKWMSIFDAFLPVTFHLGGPFYLHFIGSRSITLFLYL